MCAFSCGRANELLQAHPQPLPEPEQTIPAEEQRRPELAPPLVQEASEQTIVGPVAPSLDIPVLVDQSAVQDPIRAQLEQLPDDDLRRLGAILQERGEIVVDGRWGRKRLLDVLAEHKADPKLLETATVQQPIATEPPAPPAFVPPTE